jgi:flagellar assembly factor FliW
MEKIVTRFGEIEYDPDSILHFPAGLIGFPNLRQFVVMPNKKEGPLFWIQSIDDPSFALVLTDPTNFFLDYLVAPDSVERQHLHIDENDPCFVLTVVSVPPSQDISLNLAAPILFSPKSNRAMQVILEDVKYNSKTPLPQPAVADKVVDKVVNGG